MRLRNGDKVEIMSKMESPVSWRVAKIISCNAHSYRVQYDSHSGMTNEPKVETVSRKSVRPCPPLVHDVKNCAVGDIVEVFHDYAWKIATILKVLEGKKQVKSKKIAVWVTAVPNQYLVRLLGSSQELIIDGSNIRMRQIWRDDKWILIEKSSKVGEDIMAGNPSTSNCHHKTNFQTPLFNGWARNRHQNNYTNDHDEAAPRESHMASSRSLKRMSPYGSSTIEAHTGHAQKCRVLERDGKKQKVVDAPVLEKVDAVSYPRKNLGEKNMHASFKIMTTGHNQKQNYGVRNSKNSADSDACSVGSCSVTDQCPTNAYIPVNISLPCQETDTLCSDAESCYCLGSERSSSLPPEEEVEISIRRLELCAYRQTLEALFASGPMSWDQESLLTNLRILLHISNDEHLMELKNLISAKPASSVR